MNMTTKEQPEKRSFSADTVIDDFTNIFFIGIGGIGMSNLARYFLANKKIVGGYDRISSTLSRQLEAEGALIHYQDNIETVPARFLDALTTLVIYTPAVPKTNTELVYFKQNGFTVIKRAQALGEITKLSRAICCAGTHGKTTVSSMVAHILRQSRVDCSAFLGGILKNYKSNLLISETSDITVIEADEYDRSFHWLHPWIGIITSADHDHLDIYPTTKLYRESFEEFTELVREDGFLIMKKGIDVTPRCHESVKQYTYSLCEGDFYADKIHLGKGTLLFDFVYPGGVIKDINLGVPLIINAENAVVAAAAAWLSGAEPEEIKDALSSYQGAKRRFDLRFKSEEIVFIDDYAHHPNELTASIMSIKKLYNDKKITGIFQPHLYSRTRDFVNEFAKSLSLLDELILLDIYPAREEPIEGVTSQIIFDKVTIKNKTLCKKSELLELMKDKRPEVLVTLGAGDIDTLLPDIEKIVRRL